VTDPSKRLAATSAPASGCAKRVMQRGPADFGHPKVIVRRNRPTGVQAAHSASRRSGRAATLLEPGAPVKRCAIRRPHPTCNHQYGRLPPVRSSPSARQRSRRRNAGGERAARKARYATQPGTRKYPPGAPPPRACRLHVGIPVKWRLAALPDNRGRSRPSPRAHPHLGAGGRGDGPRSDNDRRGGLVGGMTGAARSVWGVPG